MKLAPALVQQRTVCDLLNQRVTEREKPLFERRHVVEQLSAPQMLDFFRQCSLRRTADKLEDRYRNLAADHRSNFEHPLGVLFQPVDAGRDDGLHRRNLRVPPGR